MNQISFCPQFQTMHRFCFLNTKAKKETKDRFKIAAFPSQKAAARPNVTIDVNPNPLGWNLPRD